MERLTKTGEVFTFPKVDPTENAYLERVQKRLSAYEDTGLEPNEVDQICRASKTMMFDSVADFVRYSVANFDALQTYRALGPVDELSALVKARDEGRVLPEKSMWTATCHGSKLVLIVDVKSAQEAEAALGGGGDE